MKTPMTTPKNPVATQCGCFLNLLWSPGRFFSCQVKQVHWSVPLVFLTIAAAMSTVAALVYGSMPSPLVTGSILFLNAIGTLLAGAFFGYIAARILPGGGVPFNRMFSIYAFSGGLPLLIAWLPGSFWVSELWKWWLVGIGLTRAGEFHGHQAATIIGASIGLSLCFFWSLLMLI